MSENNLDENNKAPEENSSGENSSQVFGNLNILSNVLLAPQLGMQQVQQRYGILFPILVVSFLMSFVIYTYYSTVDYVWYVDFMVEATAGELSKSEQDAARAAMSMMSQSATASISAVSLLIFIPIIFVIQSVYFVIVSSVNNDGYEFKQWLSFISWTSMPTIIVAASMYAVIVTSSNNQIPPDSLNPLSLNELIFGLESSKGLGKLLSTIHLGQIWSFALMIIGYQLWTKKTMGQSAAIVIAPFAVFYLIWFLMI